MEQVQNGGPWDIPGMLDYGVEGLVFTKYLDYFHNDVLKFEEMNQEHNMNFHYWSDLELYMSHIIT